MQSELQNNSINDLIYCKYGGEDAPSLDFFVKNDLKYENMINYVFTYQFFLKLETSEMMENVSDLLIYDGHLASTRHLHKSQRFYGNSKLQPCSTKDIRPKSEFKRIIKINEHILLVNAMMFVNADQKIFKLRDHEGFLQLRIPQRQPIIK
jgi:hypothetical protein